MYYEETLISGVLHSRTVPGGEWHPVPREELVRLLDSYARTLSALKSLVRHLMPAGYWDHVADVDRPVMQEALKAIAQAEGKSSFGNDWMDALSLVSGEPK